MNKEYCLVCDKSMGNSLNKDSDGEPVHKHCMETLEPECVNSDEVGEIK